MNLSSVALIYYLKCCVKVKIEVILNMSRIIIMFVKSKIPQNISSSLLLVLIFPNENLFLLKG